MQIPNMLDKDEKNKGVALLMAIFTILFVTTIISGSFVVITVNSAKRIRNTDNSVQGYYIAESGMEDIVYRIKSGKNYTNNYVIGVGFGTSTIAVSTENTVHTIQVSGSSNNRFRKIETILQVNTSGVEFHYGVQVGDGGLEMENNTIIQGSVYSNGSVIATGAGGGGSNCSSHACIIGDVFVAAAVAATPDQEWTTTSSDFEVGKDESQQDVAQSFSPTIDDDLTQVSFYIRKVGNPSDATIRINKDKNGRPGEKNGDVLATGSLQASLVGTSYAWIDISLSSNPTLDDNKTYWIIIDTNNNVNNYYEWALDTTDGYPNGTGKYNNDWTNKDGWINAGGDLNFRAWLGGVDKVLDNIKVSGYASAHSILNSEIGGDADGFTLIDSTVTGNAHFDSITDCTITGNADYNTKTNCAVTGTETTPTNPPADVPPLGLPISQGLIDDWVLDAEAGGTYIGDYSPPGGSTVSLGPIKITGDLLLENNQTLIVTGTIYVQGEIQIDNNGTIQLDPSYGTRSGVVFSDGFIHIKNNGVFQGSGEEGSYIMFMSLESAGAGHHGSSIDVHNSGSGIIFYAPFGMVWLHQNLTVTEIVGYKVHLENNSEIIYEQGLENAQFSAGPSASRNVNYWREIE